MKRILVQLNYILLLSFLAFPVTIQAQSSDYMQPDQVQSWMEQLQEKHPGVVSTTKIASSPGDRSLQIIRIGKHPETNQAASPAVFVGANMDGNRPLATEGAIFLTESILSDPANYESHNWYILPLGNPDAANRYFQTPLVEDSRNDLPTNDDRDELTDEDGINDLNGDGWITKMRVIHPDGEWIISDSDPRPGAPSAGQRRPVPSTAPLD